MTTCEIEGCGRPAGVPGSACGLCRAHYRRLRAYGNAEEPVRRIPKGVACSVEGCERAYAGAGYCEMHYARLRRSGMLDLQPRVPQFCHCGVRAYANGLCRKHYDAGRGRRWSDTPEASRLRAKLRRARSKGAQGNHTEAEWQAVLAEFGGGCAYCPATAETKDHVVPLASGGSHDISNIVPACRSCNSSKQDKKLIVWAGGSRWPS